MTASLNKQYIRVYNAKFEVLIELLLKIRMGCVGHVDWKQLRKFVRILLELTHGVTWDAQFWRYAERGNFTFLTARRLPLFHRTSRRAVSALFATVRLALFCSAVQVRGKACTCQATVSALLRSPALIFIDLTAQLPILEVLWGSWLPHVIRLNNVTWHRD